MGYGKDRIDLSYHLTKLPNLLGGTMFLFGIYMVYFELINVDVAIDTTRPNIIWCNWSAVLKLDIGSDPLASVVGSILYLVGALLYTVSQICDLFDLDESSVALFVEWPLTIGGACFLLAGLCELKINKVLCTPPVSLVWWVALLNSIGGFTFWASACPSFLSGQQALVVGAAGCVAYLTASSVSLIMWKGEQFGGALIPALNAAHREAGSFTVRRDSRTGVAHIIGSNVVHKSPDKLENVLNPKLSTLGLIFLHVYVFIGAFQSLVCFISLAHARDFWSHSEKFTFFFNMFLTGVVYFVIVHMILTMNSACVHIPYEQPYRALMILMRFLSVILLANSALTVKVLYDHAWKSLEEESF